MSKPISCPNCGSLSINERTIKGAIPETDLTCIDEWHDTPFLPELALEIEINKEDEYIRITALEMAIKHHRNRLSHDQSVVNTANLFAVYIQGETNGE